MGPVRKPNPLLSPAHQKLPSCLALVLDSHFQNKTSQANKAKWKMEPVCPAVLQTPADTAIPPVKNHSIVFPANPAKCLQGTTGLQSCFSLSQETQQLRHLWHFRKGCVSLHRMMPPGKKTIPFPFLFLVSPILSYHNFQKDQHSSSHFNALGKQ